MAINTIQDVFDFVYSQNLYSIKEIKIVEKRFGLVVDFYVNEPEYIMDILIGNTISKVIEDLKNNLSVGIKIEYEIKFLENKEALI